MSEDKMGGAWSFFFGLLMGVAVVILENAMSTFGFVIPFLDLIMMIIVYLAFIRSERGSLLFYIMGYFPVRILFGTFFTWIF